MYGCSKRRNDSSACSNKYCSDVLLGPFVFNYIANVIRAKDSTTNRTAKDVLERKLLRGNVFDEIEHIDAESLDALHTLLSGGLTGVEFRPQILSNVAIGPMDELSSLHERRRKSETALNRLQALYFYGEEAMPEKDFIIQKKKITDELMGIDERISELHDSGVAADETSSDEFLQKASYFIMVQNLLNERYVDYEKYIRNIEPSMARNFILSVVSEIRVENSRVKSITFKNGMTHKFIYKQNL